MLSSINCPTILCSPTVILMLLREATSETYAPGSIFHHINLPTLSYFYCLLFNLHLYHKNTKSIILSYLSDLTLVSDREGIDNPLSCWLRGVICFVQVLRTRTQPPTILIPWISKTKGNTYATLLHHPFLFKEIQHSAQEVAFSININLLQRWKRQQINRCTR